jgi:crossover junction endodeoxyribonuclease RusA
MAKAERLHFIKFVGVTTVEVTLPIPDNRTRDPSNYLPPVKAVIDGMVDAGVWPDDSPAFVSVLEPVLSKDTDEVIVRLSS